MEGQVIKVNNVLTRDSPPVFVKVTKQNNESRHNIYNEVLTSNEFLTLPDSLNETQTITIIIYTTLSRMQNLNICQLNLLSMININIKCLN